MAAGRRPPGPKGRSLSGHIAPMQWDSLGFISRAAREHGALRPAHGMRRVPEARQPAVARV